MNGFPEGLALQHQPLVEGFAKQLGLLVVHRPPGHDDAAHADLDELTCHARGELVPVAHGPFVSPAVRLVDLAQMATAQKHQLGHDFHRIDLGGGDEQPVGQHHTAAAQAIGVRQIEDAMRGDVEDPVRLAI